MEDWTKGFLTAFATVIMNDPTMSIRKHTNELKIHEKTVRTAIKQNLSPDRNFLDYTILDILENKTNATSHPNIGSLKAPIEEEWNKMTEEFILETCKLFWRCVDTITKKKKKKMAGILSKFTVLCLSYFVVSFLKLKWIL